MWLSFAYTTLFWGGKKVLSRISLLLLLLLLFYVKRRSLLMLNASPSGCSVHNNTAVLYDDAFPILKFIILEGQSVKINHPNLTGACKAGIFGIMTTKIISIGILALCSFPHKRGFEISCLARLSLILHALRRFDHFQFSSITLIIISL